jgi:hypothetical protein
VPGRMGMGAAPCTFFCARCHTHTPGRFRPSELGAGQILNGDGNHPRYSLIVASMVKRRPVFSQSAYGTGMHRIGHGARILSSFWWCGGCWAG